MQNLLKIKLPTNAKNIAADAYRAHLNGSTVDWGSILLRSTEDSMQMLREKVRQLALKELG